MEKILSIKIKTSIPIDRQTRSVIDKQYQLAPIEGRNALHTFVVVVL